jgi:hypothetical protein
MAAYAVAGALVAVTIGVRVDAEPRAVLVVRLYNASGIPARELLAARHAVESTYKDTGLDLIVRHCGRAVDPCGEPLKPFEVVVRVVNAPAFDPALHPEACGMAYLVKETDRGWLATAFSDRIGSVATRVGIDPGTLLGLVIAHEIGHLLLGSGYHGWTGIMRADWPGPLLDRTGQQWRFSTLEAARLRAAASLRF